MWWKLNWVYSTVTLQAKLESVLSTTNSSFGWSLTWRRVSSLSGYNNNCCRFESFPLCNVCKGGLPPASAALLARSGQSGFARPFPAGRFLLFGRVAASPAALGRAPSSDEDFWKREAVLHWSRHQTEPWGGNRNKEDEKWIRLQINSRLKGFLWICKYFHAVCSAAVLNNRKHLCWSRSIWVTLHTWATAEENAQKSVSTCLMGIFVILLFFIIINT